MHIIMLAIIIGTISCLSNVILSQILYSTIMRNPVLEYLERVRHDCL